MTPADLVSYCAKLFPWSIRDAATAEAWLQVYTATLGHLEPQDLKHAFLSYITAAARRDPPLPAALLMLAPVHYRAKPKAKSMRGMSDYCREAIPRLIDEWWSTNQAWLQQQLELRPGIDKDEATAAMKWQLRSDANLHAQQTYWGRIAEGTPLQASARAIGNALGGEGPRKAMTSEPSPRGPDSITRLSDEGKRIVAATFQAREGTTKQ